MPNLVTVQSMIDGARQRADMVNSQFVTDAELIGYINHVHKRFYNKVTTTFENYYVSTAALSIAAGTDLYDLPSDMLKLLGLDVNRNGQVMTLLPWSLNERNREQRTSDAPYRYIIRGTKLQILPKPDAAYTGTFLYIPVATEITNANQTVEVWNGFDEYIMLGAAVFCKQKEESDTSILMIMMKEVEQEIMDMLRGRDAGFPQRVTDVEAVNSSTLWRYY